MWGNENRKPGFQTAPGCGGLASGNEFNPVGYSGESRFFRRKTGIASPSPVGSGHQGAPDFQPCSNSATRLFKRRREGEQNGGKEVRFF